MNPKPIDPSAIKAEVAGKISPKPKMAFSDVMVGAADVAGAMMPATQELVGQWSGGGSNLANAVLFAAFNGIGTAGGMAAMQQGQLASSGNPYAQYSQSPGMMGASRMTTNPGIPGYGGGDDVTAKMVGSGNSYDSGGVAGTGVSQADLINTMNSNNLQLLELQAMMQSNMQAWTTKSNILSADHRARMSIVEKFSTRG